MNPAPLLTVLVLLSVAGCYSPAESPPAPRATARTGPATTMTTWDGAVLHTPGLDVPLEARRASFAYRSGTTLYLQPGAHGAPDRWRVVRGDRDRVLTRRRDASAEVSPDGLQVAAVETLATRSVGDQVSVITQRLVRWDLADGGRSVLDLAPHQVRCCDAQGVLELEGVDNRGRVTLLRDGVVSVWEAPSQPVEIARSGSFDGVWPGGVILTPRTPGGSAEVASDLVAVGPHGGTRVVATVPAGSRAWSSDGRTFVDQSGPAVTLRRLRHGSVSVTPLGLPDGRWDFAGWESATAVVLARLGGGGRAEALLRCDVATGACLPTADPGGTLVLQDTPY